MAQPIDNAEEKLTQYRKAADEALRSAGRATDPDVRKAYLNIMNTWIYLADELERELAFAAAIEQSDEVFVPPTAGSDAHKSR